jgi:hypothetical protein
MYITLICVYSTESVRIGSMITYYHIIIYSDHKPGRHRHLSVTVTANEGPMRILYKTLVPIYVISEMKLHGTVISETEL